MYCQRVLINPTNYNYSLDLNHPPCTDRHHTFRQILSMTETSLIWQPLCCWHNTYSRLIGDLDIYCTTIGVILSP